MENSAIRLARLNLYCDRVMEGTVSLCLARARAEIVPGYWLLHKAAKQQPQSLMPGRGEEKAIGREFAHG